MSSPEYSPCVPELERLLGHGEAAPSASVGPAALQGRAWRRRLGNLRERRDAHVTMGLWIIFYAGSGLGPKRMKKGKTELPWGDFPPARRACGRCMYWFRRGWRALPKGYERIELKILPVSTAALPH